MVLVVLLLVVVVVVWTEMCAFISLHTEAVAPVPPHVCKEGDYVKTRLFEWTPTQSFNIPIKEDI